MALGAEGGRESGATRSIAADPRGRDPHAAPQLRPPPADERHTHQLSVALAWTLVNSDYAYLPGACTRPDGESGDGAVNHNPIQFDVTPSTV